MDDNEGAAGFPTANQRADHAFRWPRAYIPSRLGENGMREEAAAICPTCTDAGCLSRVHASFEQPADFRLKSAKFDRKQGFARIEHDVPYRGQTGEIQPDGFPHPALHAIANDGFSHRSRHSKTDTRTFFPRFLPQAKRRKQRAGMPKTVVIYFPEVAAPEDPELLRKPEPWAGDRN